MQDVWRRCLRTWGRVSEALGREVGGWGHVLVRNEGRVDGLNWNLRRVSLDLGGENRDL